MEYWWLMPCIRGSGAFVNKRIGAHLLHIKLYILRAASWIKSDRRSGWVHCSLFTVCALCAVMCATATMTIGISRQSTHSTMKTARLCAYFPNFIFFNSLLASRWLFALHEFRGIAQFSGRRKPNWKLYRSDGLSRLLSCVLSSLPSLPSSRFRFVHFELRFLHPDIGSFNDRTFAVRTMKHVLLFCAQNLLAQVVENTFSVSVRFLPRRAWLGTWHNVAFEYYVLIVRQLGIHKQQN